MADGKKRKRRRKPRRPQPPVTPLQYRLRRNELLATVGNNVVRWGGLVAVAYMVLRSVEALSGQHTLADIGVNVNVKISEAVAWIFGGSGMLYGWKERRLRHDVARHVGTRVSYLERRRDPGRSSSSLALDGQTNPRDII